jgi:AcrR family transcriptional regulator
MEAKAFLQSAPMSTSAAAIPARKPRARAEAAEAQRPALTPERWIEAATEVLVDQGIDHVRVDVLATQLGVTRGSFYWHFKDREELLRAVLASWRDSTTVALTQRLESAHADPREQLRDVLSLPFRGRAAVRAARIELAIRAWARRDTMARYAVDEADAARLAHISQVFSSMGFSLTEARARAVMAYGLVVAESLAPKLDGMVEREWRNRYVESLLVQRVPGS